MSDIHKLLSVELALMAWLAVNAGYVRGDNNLITKTCILAHHNVGFHVGEEGFAIKM